MMQPTSGTTQVYSHLPTEGLRPNDQVAMPALDKSDLNILLWSLESLPGTMWAEIEQGRMLLVHSVCANRWGKISAFGVDEMQEDIELGSWDTDRYCVWRFVRIDHLAANEQFAWYVRAADSWYAQLHADVPQRGDAHLRQQAAALEIALRRLYAFAEEHQLTVPARYVQQLAFPPLDDETEHPSVHVSRHIDMETLPQIEEEALLAWLASPEGVIIHLACPNLMGFRNVEDCIFDHARALMAGETLHPFCHAIVADMNPSSVDFVCSIQNVVGFQEKLRWLVPYLCDHEDPDEDDLDYFERQSTIWDFVVELEQTGMTHFIELGDSYLGMVMRNRDADAAFEDDALIQERHVTHPEWEFDFWRSFISHEVGFPLYISQHAWIIPTENPIHPLLATYGGFAGVVPIVSNCHLCTIDGLEPMLINRFGAFSCPIDVLRNARACAERVFGSERQRRLSDEQSVYEPTLKNIGVMLRYRLASQGNLLLAQDALATYILFQDSLRPVAPEVVHFLAGDLAQLLHPINTVPCNWKRLKPVKFEQLCFDIIQQHFHPGPLESHPMGDVRSRDGGRDIVFTRPGRPGSPARKWIIQCKLLRPSLRRPEKMPSLGMRDLPSVSNIIDQYDADGYGVITSGILDPTLLDGLEAIKRNRGIEYIAWGGQQLEYYLNEHPQLRFRYFSPIPERAQ